MSGRSAARLRVGEAGDLPALELDRARGRRDQLEDRAAQRRLAAARLPDQAERLARVDGEARRRRPPGRAPICLSKMIPALIGKCLTTWLDLEDRARRTVCRLGPAARRRRRCGHASLMRAGASESDLSGSSTIPERLASAPGRGSQQRSVCAGSPARASSAASSVQLAERVRAAIAEVAALRRRDQGGRLARDLRQPRRARPVDPGQRAEQAPGVGVLGVVEDLVERARLDDLAGVHDHDPVGDLGDHAEVVGDHDHRHPELLAEAPRSGAGSAPGWSRRARSSARRRSAASDRW